MELAQRNVKQAVSLFKQAEILYSRQRKQANSLFYVSIEIYNDFSKIYSINFHYFK
jgi:hypothetical protein